MAHNVLLRGLVTVAVKHCNFHAECQRCILHRCQAFRDEVPVWVLEGPMVAFHGKIVCSGPGDHLFLILFQRFPYHVRNTILMKSVVSKHNIFESYGLSYLIDLGSIVTIVRIILSISYTVLLTVLTSKPSPGCMLQRLRMQMSPKFHNGLSALPWTE